MQYLSLKIFKDSKLIKTKIFTDDQISIGSSEGLSLQLEGLSPWHALIEKKHDIFCILDLNSESGTRLNGQKITDETVINSGAVIRIGSYEVHFFIGPPTETAVKTKSPAVQPSQPSAPKSPASSAPAVQPSQPSVPESPAPSAPAVQPSQPSAPESPAPSAPAVDEVNDLASQKEPSSSSAFSAPAFSVPNADSSAQAESLEMAAQPVSKPSQKGFWNTYAPLSQIKNLEDYLEPSIGNLIEVNVCWKERVLHSHYFSKSGDVFIGGGKNCQIFFPNMQDRPSYKLLTVSSGAQIYLSGSVTGALFQGKEKSTRISHALKGNQSVTLKPYEMIRLDFDSNLKLYVRLINKPALPPKEGLLNLRLSEALALLLAFLLTALLFFYGALYAPSFLADDIDFIDKEIRTAQVVFKKKPEKRKVIKYDLDKKTVKSPVVAKKKKSKLVKKPAIKANVKKTVKKISSPKKGRQGKMAAVAKGRKPPKKTRVKVGSARPGGSIKTGKKGSSAKTVAPDPTKVGVVGMFGSGGKLSELDKGASGPGGLTGLANEASGYSGTPDAYEGKGLGTKTKEFAGGGKGKAIQGISGIKTKGRGFGLSGTGTGGLGERGRLSMEFSSTDVDVTGEIDKNAILRVIKRNQPKFERCYQTSLNEKTSVQGNLSMKWVISAKGRGQNARSIESDIDSRTLKNCVANVLESLIFPEPPSGQIPEVRFTFRFYL